MKTQVRTREVIEVKECRGEGVKGDPCREVVCYTNMMGEFLAEKDSYARTLTAKDIKDAWNPGCSLKELWEALGFKEEEV